MDATRSHLAGDRGDGRWRLVRTSDLRGEAKLAWWQLWYELAGGRPATIVVTAADVGAWQGRTERAGTRALEALTAAGLLYVHERRGLRWHLTMVDPADVQRARLTLPVGETQLELELQPPAEVAPLPPPPNKEQSARAIQTEHSAPTSAAIREDVVFCGLLAGGCSTTSAGHHGEGGRGPSLASTVARGRGREASVASNAGPTAISGLLGTVTTPDVADVANAIRRLAAMIIDRVGNSAAAGEEPVGYDLAWSVAEAVHDGRYSLRALEAVLSSTHRARVRGTRAAYFAGAVRRSARQHGVAL